MNETAEQPGDAEIVARPSDRVLACIGASPSSVEVIRAAHRFAGPGGTWIALHVRRPEQASAPDEARVAQHLKLAESLGAESVVLAAGADQAAEIIEFARRSACLHLIIGKSGNRRWIEALRPSLVERVIAGCHGIDVLVVRRNETSIVGGGTAGERRSQDFPLRYPVAVLLATIGCVIAIGCDRLGLSEGNVVLAHMLAVTATAAMCGRGPTVLASFLAVLSFNYFFTAPRRTFVVDDPQYLFAFAAMLLVGLVTSSLASRVRLQRKSGRAGQERANRLHELSRGLSAASGAENIAAVAAGCLKRFVGGDVCIYARGRDGTLVSLGPDGIESEPALAEVGLLDLETDRVRVSERRNASGWQGRAIHLPLVTPDRVIGVLASVEPEVEWNQNTEDARFVGLVASQLALALARDQLTEEMHRAHAEAEAERLRGALLSSVSHDLRTPLAAILGAATSLLNSGAADFDARKRGLLEQIRDESNRLARLVENLLHMTRLESGVARVAREWHVVEDLVGSAIDVVEKRTGVGRIRARVAPSLPLLLVDGVLMELVLTNLLENALKYAPGESEIVVEAAAPSGRVCIAVQDSGPGLTQVEIEHVFEKFYRGAESRVRGVPGVGLGLCIVDAVVRLHEARITASNVAPSGARFCVEFPVQPQPPTIEWDDEPVPGGESS